MRALITQLFGLRWPEEWHLDVWQGKLLYTMVVVLATWLLIVITRKLVKRAIRRVKKPRVDTVVRLISNLITYVLIFIAGFSLLNNVFDVDTTALLATAGVLGVAIGFGAQTLVKDVITGLFLLLDDQFFVGETITLDGFTGVVEIVGLRTTSLRGENGEIFHIPNGSIVKVINHSRK